MSKTPDPNASDEDDVAGTPHPIPGGEIDSPALVSFAPDPYDSDEDDGSEYEDPARTPHPVPGGIG